MKKIAFYGNSCTGKTSSLYMIASGLTKQGKSFRIQNMPYDNSGHMANDEPFPPELLESCPEARLHFIFDQLARETAEVTKNKVDFLLCEMTSMDLFHFYQWVCELKDVRPSSNVYWICHEWMKTYDTIYSMPDTCYYFSDGSRYKSDVIKKAVSKFYTTNITFENMVRIDLDVKVRCYDVLEKFSEKYL